MRISWLFGTAAIALALFGIGLLVAPTWLFGFYGLASSPDSEVIARVLGAPSIYSARLNDDASEPGDALGPLEPETPQEAPAEPQAVPQP